MLKVMMMMMMMLWQLVSLVLADHSFSPMDDEKTPAENQCPTCQGGNEVDCNSKITMVACPKEAPICAVYKSIYDEFSRHCVSQEEYNHIVSECEKYRDCSMVTYVFQCPTCIGEGKDEATAKANCDINIKKKTCSRKTPVCAVYYIPELRKFARHCMNQILYDKTVEKCQSKGCKAEKCTQPGCMGGEMPVFEGIQCPSCEGKDENDCDSQIKMEVCPKETPTCAVYTSDKGHFNRGCVNQAEYETLLNKCEEHGDCTIRKYEFQCPSCSGMEGNGKTAEADCNEKIKMETCTQKHPICEAVSDNLGTLTRNCTNEMDHSITRNNCNFFQDCKASKCTEPRCMA